MFKRSAGLSGAVEGRKRSGLLGNKVRKRNYVACFFFSYSSFLLLAVLKLVRSLFVLSA